MKFILRSYYPYVWLSVLRFSIWCLTRLDNCVHNLGCPYNCTYPAARQARYLATDLLCLAILFTLALLSELFQALHIICALVLRVISLLTSQLRKAIN